MFANKKQHVKSSSAFHCHALCTLEQISISYQIMTNDLENRARATPPKKNKTKKTTTKKQQQTNNNNNNNQKTNNDPSRTNQRKQRARDAKR